MLRILHFCLVETLLNPIYFFLFLVFCTKTYFGSRARYDMDLMGLVTPFNVKNSFHTREIKKLQKADAA